MGLHDRRAGWKKFVLWAILVAVLHFVIATVCGVLGHQAGSLTMSGVILQSLSQVMFFPLYELMGTEGFRGFVTTYFPGAWGHIIAFTGSLVWGFALVALFYFVRHRIAVRRAAKASH